MRPAAHSRALLHCADLPITLLTLAANGLTVDPTSRAWIRWEQHPRLAAGVRARGEPPLQLGDGVDAWAAISRGAASSRSEVRTCDALVMPW